MNEQVLTPYDAECESLALYFLEDEGPVSVEDVRDLSAHIQQSIESWFVGRKAEGRES